MGKDKQQQDENRTGKIQLQKSGKLLELQGRWRLCQQLGHAHGVWKGEPTVGLRSPPVHQLLFQQV